jgi:mono/diheme cytochrome c family protein
VPSAGALGKIAWGQYCAACHNATTGQGPSKGANASSTMAAINGGISQMTYLKGTVTATDAANIAVYGANPGAY